jgi:hypothetical protein
MEELPHVVITSDCDWEPSSLDYDIDPKSFDWYDNESFIDSYRPHPFTQSGSYKHCAFHTLISHDTSSIHETKTQTVSTDFESLRPRFGGCSTDTIRHTFDNTTQIARSLQLYGDMRKHFRSRFPAFNVSRRNESVATDTIYSDTPAIDDGSKCAQAFVGRELLVTDI